jgi:ADP-ribose pyrophosphatase
MRPWRTLARRVLVSRPPWLEVAEERVALPDGREIDSFLSLHTRDFASIVAVTDDEKVVLVRSYKHGTRTVSLAAPAGYLEEGESPLGAAKRELREETGYEARDWTGLGSFVVDGNYGVCTEHAFLALGARKVAEPQSDDLEEIEVVLDDFGEIGALLLRGDVAQLSAALALALAHMEIERRAPPPPRLA